MALRAIYETTNRLDGYLVRWGLTGGRFIPDPPTWYVVCTPGVCVCGGASVVWRVGLRVAGIMLCCRRNLLAGVLILVIRGEEQYDECWRNTHNSPFQGANFAKLFLGHFFGG